MFLSQKSDGSLIEILDLKTLFNPAEAEVIGRSHSGEEMQDTEKYAKSELDFPSGESLPNCWLNSTSSDGKTMFISHKSNNSSIEILDLESLFNPAEAEVAGKSHSGEEGNSEDKFAKSELMFASGESLPRCWVDADYRDPS